MTQLTTRHFLFALALALALHGAIAAAIFWAPDASGAKASGTGGIEVSLGPAGAAPGDVAPVAPDVQEAPPAPVEEAAPVRAPLQAEPVPPEEAKPEEAAAATLAEDSDALEAEAQERAMARSRVPPPPTRPDRSPNEPENVRKAAAAPPANSGAGGRAGKEIRGDAGNGHNRSGGGTPGAADYTARLLAWLQRHKRYPRDAMARRDEGTALLYFELGSRGQVLTYTLRRSSGHKALDREALALIRRAQPLPAPPPGLAGAPLRLVVPVRFSLR